MIPLFKVFMAPEVPEEISKILKGEFIGQGPKVDEYEDALRAYFGIKYLVTTNSATSAEHLTFHLLKKYGLRAGDEVLVTALSCSATHFPVLANGLKIKWVDINPKNLNIDLKDLRRKISPQTRVIYLVHWGGYPNDLDEVEKIANGAHFLYGFRPFIVEDCAHSWGSKYKGKLIGTHGNICTFSLQAIKHQTAIDGGFIITPKEDFYKRAVLQRWYGIDRTEKRSDFRLEKPIEEWGFKFHMNDVNAIVGFCNLKYADEIVAKHKANRDYYDRELKEVPGVTLLEREEGFDSSCWIYSLLVEDRVNFNKAMTARGISVSQVHERVDKHPCVSEFKADLPALDTTIGRLTHIPVHWGVSVEDREYIVQAIKSGW